MGGRCKHKHRHHRRCPPRARSCERPQKQPDPPCEPRFQQKNIVSDVKLVARATDPNIKNSWGNAFSCDAKTYFVVNNGTNTVTHYNTNNATPVSTDPVVTTPADPTGIAVNCSATDFKYTFNTKTAPATWIVVTEGGQIAAYNSTVSPGAAQVVATPGGILKGATIAGSTLYVTDFFNGNILVFDNTFAPVTTFTDPDLVAAGYAPFNIYTADGKLYVTFALQDEDAEKDVPGVGNGYIDVFAANGVLESRFANRGSLNSPWGMIATRLCGKDVLLVGNAGDGRIQIFQRSGTGVRDLLGYLRDCHGNILSIDRLWGLLGFESGSEHHRHLSSLLFSAGINTEANGLIGRLCTCA